MDNNNSNPNDRFFTEPIPESLKQSILAQAETELAGVRKREKLKSFAFLFGGLVTASFMGVLVTRNILKTKSSTNATMAKQDQEPPSAGPNMEIGSDVTLASEFELAEWKELDLDTIQNLEEIEGLSDEDFEIALSEEDV